MRQLFIAQTDIIPEAERDTATHAEDLPQAREIAPWASEIVEVEGGWQAFESVDDAEVWRGQR
jgi:hypothetical protein